MKIRERVLKGSFTYNVGSLTGAEIMNEIKTEKMELTETETNGTSASAVETIVKHMERFDVLDTCCGSKMFWLEEGHDNVLFADIRSESHVLCDGRDLEIKPDVQIDFRNMPFPDNSFNLVVFDPPHLKSLGKDSWMAKKYGRLFPTWEDDIRQGFQECFRVLKPKGTLIFKWNETQIKVSEILELTNEKPLFGHISGKAANTHWITFMKRAECA